jgi:hypothetical protein
MVANCLFYVPIRDKEHGVELLKKICQDAYAFIFPGVVDPATLEESDREHLAFMDKCSNMLNAHVYLPVLKPEYEFFFYFRNALYLPCSVHLEESYVVVEDNCPFRRDTKHQITMIQYLRSITKDKSPFVWTTNTVHPKDWDTIPPTIHEYAPIVEPDDSGKFDLEDKCKHCKAKPTTVVKGEGTTKIWCQCGVYTEITPSKTLGWYVPREKLPKECQFTTSLERSFALKQDNPIYYVPLKDTH